MNLELAKSVDRSVGGLLVRILAAGTRLAGWFSRRGEVEEVRTILLVKLWGLGNLVLLYPVISRVRRTYPGARIVVLTFETNRDLAERHPGVDEVVGLALGSWWRLAFALPGVVRRLRALRPDLVLDFEQFCHLSGILARLSRGAQTIGFSLPGRHRGAIYHVRVPYREARHMGEIFSDVARAAGVPSFAYELEPIPLRASERAAAQELLAPLGGRALVVLHAGSGDNFPGRRWPASSFAALVARILARYPDACAVFTGVEGEEELAASIRGELPEVVRPRTLSLVGRTDVATVTAVLERASLVLSNDTGPVHLGASMGVPVFAFYGPNTPILYGPLGPGSRAFYAGLPCSPCITNANAKSSSCRMPVCMRQITVADVFEAVRASRALEATETVRPADRIVERS